MSKTQKTEPGEAVPGAVQDVREALAADSAEFRKLLSAETLARKQGEARVLEEVGRTRELVELERTRRVDMADTWLRFEKRLVARDREIETAMQAFGAAIRKAERQLSEMQELARNATDPHRVVRPVKDAVGILRDEVAALGGLVERRSAELRDQLLEAVPAARRAGRPRTS